jgi:hypothetical protein
MSATKEWILNNPERFEAANQRSEPSRLREEALHEAYFEEYHDILNGPKCQEIDIDGTLCGLIVEDAGIPDTILINQL